MLRKGILALLFSLYMAGYTHAQTESIGSSLNDSLLIVYLRSNYTPTSPKNYDRARDSMYTSIDVDESDSLTGVYSGLRAKADGSRTPSNGSLSFNTEHSWPQSFYDNAEPMRGDIHHLYPVWSSANSSRGNNPFGEVDDNETTSWWYWKNGEKLETIPSSNIDEYSEYANSVFEPREDHKGNAARAMFYFWTMYQTNSEIINDAFDNEAFFEGMKNTLYQWHQLDPVDDAEVARSLEVESVQGNKNPFIHDTTLVRRAYFYQESTPTPSSSDVFISEVYEANGGTVKYLELFNDSDTSIDFALGEWELLRYTNSGTSPSYTIALSGTIASKSFFVVGDDNSSSGVQSIFGEGLVDQNTSQVNHNGNDSYVLIKNASTTADTVDSFSKDNIGNSSNFSTNQVAYRIYSALPNDGSFGQTSTLSNGDTVASGNWVVFDITSANSNAKMIATPGYSKGIESSRNPESLISGSAQWRLISIPANNASVSEISDDTSIQGIDDSKSPNIFTYNSSGEFSSPASENATLANGEGLVLYFFNNTLSGSNSLPLILDTPNDEPSSNVTVALNTNTIESGSYFTLVGNPFQSNYDVSSITSDNPLQSNIHLVEDGMYFTQPKVSTILLPWQGFWVESGTVSPATNLTFPTSGKTHTSATTSAFSKIFQEDFAFEFQLKSSHSFDRGCRIDFKMDAVNGWDIHDATKLKPIKNEFATIACLENGKQKSVHSLPSTLEEETTIKLAVESVNVDEELKLTWNLKNFPTSDYKILLEDTFSGNIIDLSIDSSYSFIESTTLVKASNQNVSNPQFLKEGSESRFSITFLNTQQVSSENEVDSPNNFIVHQNYPNPFNPSTQISFELPASSEILVQVFDAKGSLVKTLANQVYTAGDHSLVLDGSNLSSGVYFYRIVSQFGSISKPMLLLK